jgi:hypothetical protein
LTADGPTATLLADSCDPLATPLGTEVEGEHGRAAKRDGDALPDDFDDDEIDEAREFAYEAGLGEGDWLLVIDPEDA